MAGDIKNSLCGEETMTAIVSTFAALADPTRLRMLVLVRSMELSVGELAQVLGQSQPRVSRHLKILADAGLVVRRKEGAWTFVGLGSDDRVMPALAAIDQWGASDPENAWIVADAARLTAVRADRAIAAERYFSSQAERWDAIRSLHVSESEVEAAIKRALAGHSIGHLVDVGTGTGRMIELFADQARDIAGIDRSAEMLRLARAKLEEAGINADLRQADMYALPLPSEASDTVILHQVLHFAQHPAAAIMEAARLLKTGGRLLIADFAPHEREDLRRDDAHVRLGFADNSIIRWMEAAGLNARIAEKLSGGELTVTLWLGERTPSSSRLRRVA